MRYALGLASDPLILGCSIVKRNDTQSTKILKKETVIFVIVTLFQAADIFPLK